VPGAKTRAEAEPGVPDLDPEGAVAKHGHRWFTKYMNLTQQQLKHIHIKIQIKIKTQIKIHIERHQR